jgi:hypothetical protein
MRPAAAVWPDESPSAAQNPGQFEPERGSELLDFLLGTVDEIGPALCVLALRESVPDGPDAPADAVARLDDGDRGASGQVARRREPGGPRPRPAPIRRSGPTRHRS